MATINLHIGRIVWHGDGPPDAVALSSAIGHAVEQAVVGVVPAVVPADNAATACAQAVARQVLPRLPARSGWVDG